MNQDLNFKHLRYFNVIAREGSIVRASKKLYLTQSTLSDQLRQLEEYFGCKLFDRKPRKLLLNENGRLAMEYVNRIFETARELEISIRRKEKRRMKFLKVGVIPSLPKVHVRDFLKPMLRSKELVVSIREGSLPHLLKQLEIGNLDIALSDVSVASLKSKMFSQRLMSRSIVAVGHSSLSKHKTGFPKSLDGLPFINFTEHSQLRNEIDSYFKSHEIHPDMIAEVDDVNMARVAIENTPAFAFLPYRAVADEIHYGRLCLLGKVIRIHSDMWALGMKNGLLNDVLDPVIQRFLDKQ